MAFAYRNATFAQKRVEKFYFKGKKAYLCISKVTNDNKVNKKIIQLK